MTSTRSLRAIVITVVVSLATPALARAQGNATVTLSVASAGTAFPVPTAADYFAGYIDNPVELTYTGTLRGPSNGTAYTGYVEICALAADLGNGKPLSDLLWRPSNSSAPFQPVVQGCTGPVSAARLAGSYALAGNLNERKFAGGVVFRMVLRWTDTAASYGVPLGAVTSMTSP